MTTCAKEPLPDCVEKLATLQAEQRDQSGKLDRILKHLEGNGREGLIVKVDRLEQSEERRKWALRAIAGAVVGLAVKAFWGVFQ